MLCDAPVLTHTYTCVAVVLSELYQKKLLTAEDVSMMRKSGCTLDQIFLVQCVKPAEILVKTAGVLDTLDCTEEATMLRGILFIHYYASTDIDL